MWEALVEAKGLQPEYFQAKKGQALIWAANLLHGGSRQKDPSLTRWSQVTHYYFEGCSYYSPMESDPFYGRIYFRQHRNIANGSHAQRLRRAPRPGLVRLVDDVPVDIQGAPAERGHRTRDRPTRPQADAAKNLLTPTSRWLA